ncbi:MAG: VCBS repeat-containing protein, partial [Eudoraea sp.]|nr:VCBS repeat-containing protein [Eudoraea sp.]
GLEYPYPSYQYYLKNGYAPQYMQNTLHLNLGNERFSEIAYLSGLAATEWSWGGLLADFDNDSFKDVYITNGIKRATNDMDFISFIANESIQKRLKQGMSSEDMEFIDDIPQKKVSNYMYKNNGDASFSNVTSEWYKQEPSYSNGVVYADLDNDGDLDIVVNNIDEEALVLKNNTNTSKDAHYIQIQLKGSPNNQYGIGAKVIAYTPSGSILQENYVSRGYLSAVPNRMHIGLGKNQRIDSVRIIWPQGTAEIRQDVKADTTLFFKEIEATSTYLYPSTSSGNTLLNNSESPILFTHKDPPTLEFDREPLVPFANTNEGPEISVADINNDGLDDLFISGAKGQPSQFFIQEPDGTLHAAQEEVFLEDAMNEDVSQLFFDANGDGWEDLLVVSGGNEFLNGLRLRPRLYINKSGTFVKDSLQFKTVEMNASGVTSLDIDTDGDLDVLITSDQIPQQFGASSKQYVFLNDGDGKFNQSGAGAFEDIEAMPNVKSIISADIDNDGQEDLIAAGYWMPISILKNEGGNFIYKEDSGLKDTKGWWNTLVADDFDNDGDIDLVAGNWGLNSRLKASKEKPINLYRSDFDQNGSVEPLVTYYEGDIETPFASKDELVKQMPFLNKEFLSYKRFAEASLDELFTSQKLTASDRKQLYELSSIYMENDGKGNFTIKKLPLIAQASVIRDIMVDDFNDDGFKDLFLVGNTHEISTQLGRMDALHGLILLNDKKGQFYWAQDQNFDVQGPARSIQKINIDTRDYYIVGINNAAPVFLIKNDK